MEMRDSADVCDAWGAAEAWSSEVERWLREVGTGDDGGGCVFEVLLEAGG